ncbi:MAG: V-type ATP synthase subunit I [Chlamydiia bacterium]|nr:V-type ATP synthase subunit I [Chlamydiia bacterium]
MRIDVKKFLFVGMHGVRNAFFNNAQEFGVVHFIDSNPSRPKELPLDIQHLMSAIKVLRGLPPTEQEEIEEFSLADGLANKILENKHKLEKLIEEQRVLKLEISRVEVFGDFSKKDITFIEEKGNRKIQFWCAKKGYSEDPELPEEALFVGSDHGLDYFMSVSKEMRQYDDMIEMRIDQPLGLLQKRQEVVVKEILDTEERLKEYEKYNTFLHHALIYKMNTCNLHIAEEYAQNELDDTLFAVEGWVPLNKIEQLDALVQKNHVHYEEIAIEEGDTIPTYLENHGPARIGQDLVQVYDTPSVEDKDPSLWVLVFFSLFFAFIVGDGGYGFIFLAAALYLRFKMGNIKKGGRRALNLFTILCVSCIGWGFLTGSFFGLQIAPDNPVQSVSLVRWLAQKKTEFHLQHQDATWQAWEKEFPTIKGMTDPDQILETAAVEKDTGKDYVMYSKFADNIMMELALLTGVIHVALSLGRYAGRNWAAVGWITFIIGGYLYLPSYLKATSLMSFVFGFSVESLAVQGIYLLEGGLIFALVASIIQHKFSGLLEITSVIQIFSDILSYLRLYALALAGSIISGIVNEFAASSIFVFSILLILIGHGINMVLAIMGGVIHGLRLNFIEWYHYSFDGGGILFNPLRKLEVD